MQVNSFEDCVSIENLAVADESGNLKLNVLKDYIGSSSINDKAKLQSFNRMSIEVERAVMVKAVTLDSFCKENKIPSVNLIKMDIEGYEDKAYAGMRKIVSASKDLILLVEFTKEAYNDPAAFYGQMLSDFGHVYLIGPEGVLDEPQDTSYSKAIEASTEWVMPVFSKNPIKL